jgi:hypothetical protein
MGWLHIDDLLCAGEVEASASDDKLADLRIS